MGKKSKKAEAAAVIELDPILPLPAGTGIPDVKQGDGKSILSDTTMKVVELPYRAFYSLWEVAEQRAVQQYPKYVGGPMDNAAQMSLEAVRAFREAALGVQFPELSETEAVQLRARAAKNGTKPAPAAKPAKKSDERPDSLLDVDDNTCPKCGPNRTIIKKKVKATKEKGWKCSDCGFWWPREGSESPSESLRRLSSTQEAPQRPRKRQSAKETPAKNEKKAKSKTK